MSKLLRGDETQDDGQSEGNYDEINENYNGNWYACDPLFQIATFPAYLFKDATNKLLHFSSLGFILYSLIFCGKSSSLRFLLQIRGS